MPTVKTIAAGAGALGAASLALLSQPVFKGPDNESADAIADTYQMCLKSSLSLFKDVKAQCYNRKQIYVLLDRPLVNRDGDAVSVSLTHPSDASIAIEEASTCRQYREYVFDGWFAMTTRDMRREGYFKRACGVLTVLFEAQEASTQHFSNGSPTDEEVASLAPNIRFGEFIDGALDTVSVSQSQRFQWEITMGDQTVYLTELANADFDNDGVEEILAFSAGMVADGTARFYQTGLLEKDRENASLRFTPLKFEDKPVTAAGG
ncbi:hypothetical protein [Hyphococcus sp. DH-69]|uniref:hypothetical protein n=1 Tax=Hyphococcus formosus TaxID=3143534 RepID=UPI00398AE3F0